MDKILVYLNPLARLGYKKYSFFFPLIATLLLTGLSELYAYNIAKNPDAVGAYIIFLHVVFILYFAFRDGLRGGVIVTVLAISYYIYILYSRGYTGERLISGIETSAVLAILYTALGVIIGSLKERIDTLIDQEADEKKRLHAIVEQLPVGVIITDHQGRVTLSNKKIESLIGMKLPKDFVVGREPLLKTTYRGRELTPSRGPLAQVLATGKAVSEQEMTVTRKDGKQVYLQTSASVIKNKKDKIIAAASITHDVSQQKELEKRKDDFINMASHELRTPVTSMLLYLDVLLKMEQQNNNQSVANLVHKVKNQTEKLQMLVNDLLDVSRIQSGRLIFSKEVFPLHTLLEETINEVREISDDHEILYTSKTKALLNADRFRIYQVIINLLTNARKYSPAGTKIIVSFKKEKGKALIAVKDSGIGIEKEKLSVIFERLYQVSSAAKNTMPGLGLGLYISQQIIKRHRGKIWVDSEKGKGSVFYISLPLTKN